jgi:peroxiredoxin
MTYKNEEIKLTDEFIDIGYMAENFEAIDSSNEESIEVKRSGEDIDMSLFISFPSCDGEFLTEIEKIDKLLTSAEINIASYLIVDSRFDNFKSISNRLERLKLVFDEENEFGEMYGTKIVSNTLKDKLTKALFVVNRDGSIFFIDMPDDIEKPLDIDRLLIELNKAYSTYRGVGCHG